MSQFKVPPFISHYFDSLNHEEKQEAIERYKRWYEGQYTELFTTWLESQYEDLLDEEERKGDFLSWFQFSYVSIRNKARRGLLREILAKMDCEV